MNLDKFTTQKRILELPREKNRIKYDGLPIPWDANGSNPSVDYPKIDRAHTNRICGVCGQKIKGQYLYLIVSTEDENKEWDINKTTTSESPMHRDCAAICLYLCPVLVKPNNNTWFSTHVVRCTSTERGRIGATWIPIDPQEIPVFKMKQFVKRCPYEKIANR